MPENSEKVQDAYRFCPNCAAENQDPGSIPFRCRECDFANFFGPVSAVGGLIINDENELLLVRRARNPGKGKWGLPGGFVDPEETIEHALAREIVEETQLHLTDFSYLFSHPNTYAYRGIASPVIDLFFVCKVQSVAALKLAQDELDFHLWVRPTPEHLDDMAFHSNRLAIEKWLHQSRE